MDTRNETFEKINLSTLTSNSPAAAAAAVITDEQTSNSHQVRNSLLFVAGTKNPCTFFSMLPKDVTSIISPMLLTPVSKEQVRLAPTSILKLMTDMSKDKSNIGTEIYSHLTYSLQIMLYQAIIDDERKTVEIILDACPQLLLTRHKQNIIIESQYTWQKFKINANETPISVAAKRRQIEMLTLLLGYYDQLVQDKELDETSRQAAHESKISGLATWPICLNIPAKYIDDINQLINIFTKESFPFDDLTKLSPETEESVHFLLNLLIPETAVELDKHIDIELLLLASYQLYLQRFHEFANIDQRNVFCIHVIGLIQSALSPETAKVFCQGIFEFVMRNIDIGEAASQLKLQDTNPFYRASREPLSGLGKSHLVIAGRMENIALVDSTSSFALTRFLSGKNTILNKLIQQSESRPQQSSSWCAIL